MKAIRTLLLLAVLIVPGERLLAAPPAGQVVWWGRSVDVQPSASEPRIGVLSVEGEILTNVIALVASGNSGAALRSDGTVYGCASWGPSGTVMTEDGGALTNVVSIGAEGGRFWAIRRDGSVAAWGASGQPAALLAGVSNTVAFLSGGRRSELSLTGDGRIICELDSGELGFAGTAEESALIAPSYVKVAGQPLTNVVALAGAGISAMPDGGMGPFALSRDGEVQALALDMINPATGYLRPPDMLFAATSVRVGGEVLSNVVAITSVGGHNLALKTV